VVVQVELVVLEMLEMLVLVATTMIGLSLRLLSR
jgi:hypothetical protein